jgi:hypothetical protein
MQLPAALPDETLFSRYVRHMTILGMNENNYLKFLFNRKRVSIHPYLTIGIKKASQISGEDVSSIYKNQTLGRFFSYFMPHKSADIYKAMLNENGDRAFRACQLVSCRESEVLSLKYCPLCAQEDMKNHGVSYWHLLHQVPGIEACPLHKVWLVHRELPTRPHVKWGFLPEVSTRPEKCSFLSYKFAKFTRTLLAQITMDTNSYDQKILLEKVCKHGYMSGKKRFKRALLTSKLFNFTNKLTHCDKGLLPYSETDYRYLSYLLSGQASQHPFKYLLVDFWLDNTPKLANTELIQSMEKLDMVKNEKIEELCITLLQQHESLAQISRIIGKSRCYVKSVAMKRNIPFQKKPYILTDETIKQIVVMAYKGFHRRTIARNYHISTGSVEQIISSEPGLVEKRRRYKFEAKRRRYKAQILRTLKQQPLAIKQEIKKACYAAFHWLYAHEKAWLNLTLPSPTKPIVRSKVNWEKRDIELAPQVSNIMHNINGAISRAELDKAIGGHGWLIRMKHKLPITMNIIKQLQK